MRDPSPPPADPGQTGNPERAAPAPDLQDRFADLVDALLEIPGVTPPSGGSGFGRSAVRFRGKILAMLVRGELVLKLPAARVGQLVEAGEGTRFDANKGTPMREWLSLSADSTLDWLPLAREARHFVRPGGRR